MQDNFFEVLLFDLETWTKLNRLGKIQTWDLQKKFTCNIKFVCSKNNLVVVEKSDKYVSTVGMLKKAMKNVPELQSEEIEINFLKHRDLQQIKQFTIIDRILNMHGQTI